MLIGWEKFCLIHWVLKRCVPFCRGHFRCILIKEIYYILDDISLNVDSEGSVDSKPSLVQVVVWHWIGNKPLFEQVQVCWRICFIQPQWTERSDLLFQRHQNPEHIPHQSRCCQTGRFRYFQDVGFQKWYGSICKYPSSRTCLCLTLYWSHWFSDTSLTDLFTCYPSDLYTNSLWTIQ